MFDQGCGLEARPGWVRRQFLADTRASKLKGNFGTITKRCIFVDAILAVPDTNNLIVNIELTKIKVTVVINVKWHNLDYPFCLVVGRHSVFCDLQTQYSPSGVRVRDYENWPVVPQKTRSRLQ
jgi:hypothetical protein